MVSAYGQTVNVLRRALTLFPRVGYTLAMHLRPLLLLMAITSLAFATPAARAQADGDRSLTVFAAASLTDVLEQLGRQYEAQTGRQVTFNFQGSTSLARQITLGVRADVFISAGAKPFDDLTSRGLLQNDSRVDLLANTLVLAAREDSPLKGLSLDEALGRIQRLALADPKTAPAGRYAEQALRSLGVWEMLSRNMVVDENVRLALGRAQIGVADAIVCYRTDVLAARDVPGLRRPIAELAEFPHSSYTPIRYPAAVTQSSRQPAAARAFLAWLQTPAASQTFAAHGFTPLADGAETRPAESLPAVEVSSDLLTSAEWQVIRRSLWVSAAAAVGLLPLGLLLGWLLGRKRFPGRWVIEGVVMLPLVLPPVVTGFLALLVLTEDSLLGGLMRRLTGEQVPLTPLAAVIAAAIVALPLMVRSIRTSMEGVDARLESAAATLGASRWRVFWTVTVPLSIHGVVAGLLLAFGRALGEFGATIVLAGQTDRTRTIPLAIFRSIESNDPQMRVGRLIVVAVVLALLSTLGSELLTRRARGGK